MTTQTITSDNFPCLSITYDDATGNVSTITLDVSHVSVTKIPSGIALNSNRSEAVESAFFDQLLLMAASKFNAINCPVAVDTNNTIFDSQGIITRDSGQTDANGNPITETQLYKKTSLIQFFKFSPEMIFTPSNAVNDND